MTFNSIIEAQHWFAENWETVWGELSAIGFYHWALINHSYLYDGIDVEEDKKYWGIK